MPVQPAPTIDLLAELRWRGMFQAASEGLEERLRRGPIAGYVGFDPSGPSLHIGHLVQVFLLTHLQRAGGRPVAVVGGGTGMIGDPSGTSAERNLLDEETLAANKAAIREQLGRFIEFGAGAGGGLMVDNRDWLGRFGLLDFLRDVGKHFPMGPMLAKESVQQRLAGGMSYTEFSYMTLQATDFLVLHRDHGVDLQMGGSDQWGNITAGLDLIRRVEGREEGAEPTSFALCSPLLLNAAGEKMGKTARGAVFLDPGLTSPYAFYQYCVTQDDTTVGSLLRMLTLLPREAVEALEAEQAARPEARAGQHAFAHDLTARVHGAAEADLQARVAEAAFSGSVIEDPTVLAELHAHAEGFDFGPELLRGDIVGLVARSGLFSSNGEARRTIAQGGLSVNGQRVTAAGDPVPAPIAGEWLVVRAGKRRLAVGRLSS
ncbi:MAG: tyrosine--tRNA ligase [Candidatus Limnocylindrales bacterium]